MRSREENLAALRAAFQEIEPGQKFVVDDFRPGDALGVALLYYAIYGEGFAVDSVYDPDALLANAKGPELHMVVGRTERGDIIGLYSLFRNPPGPRIMEAGGWAVLPAYRKTSLAMRLAQRIHAQPPERLGLDAIFGQSVCDHVITQKLSEKYGAGAYALELDAMPPRPEAGASSTRVTLLDQCIIFRDTPHAVHLPEPDALFLREMYSARGLSRELLPDGGPAGASRVTVQHIAEASLARFTVEACGRDFTARLAELERESANALVRHLVLPLDRPGTTSAVLAARERGYFLGGLLPLWTGHDALLLQRLAAAPDFSRVQLYSDEAKRILEAVRADWASLHA